MTVSECLKDWLNGFDKADIREIATDFINGDLDSYAIFKSPNKTVVPFLDGSSITTEYYQFFARQSSSEDTDRVDNQEFLSEMEEWVRKKIMRKITQSYQTE